MTKMHRTGISTFDKRPGFSSHSTGLRTLVSGRRQGPIFGGQIPSHLALLPTRPLPHRAQQRSMVRETLHAHSPPAKHCQQALDTWFVWPRNSSFHFACSENSHTEHSQLRKVQSLLRTSVSTDRWALPSFIKMSRQSVHLGIYESASKQTHSL